VERLSFPPEKQSDAKTKSKQGLNRVYDINASFYVKPGIQDIGPKQPQIRYRAGSAQRWLRRLGPTEDEQIRGWRRD
jgi:hypothetical protein